MDTGVKGDNGCINWACGESRRDMYTLNRVGPTDLSIELHKLNFN